MSIWNVQYERENSQMDLMNVPLDKVTIEVKEENKALIETLRRDLAEATRKADAAETAKRYWLNRYEQERAHSRTLTADLTKAKAAQGGGGHRYVSLVKHLSERKRRLEGIKADAAREMAWEEGLGAEERLNEIDAALGAAGVR
ncbi:hypothetical protein AB0O76_40800 [Streptomyces sp. NPDC086554]|uniref:hypothetical protein n=1 Tax=Streptomyces sp. NPDC086554 TaxID=3154864 RepID=UPI003421515A